MNKENKYSPIKAISYGFLLSLGLGCLIKSIVHILSFIALAQFVNTNDQLNAVLYENSIFQITEIVILSVFYFYCAKVTLKYSGVHQLTFLLILSLVSQFTMSGLYFFSGGWEVYPLWYSVVNQFYIMFIMLTAFMSRSKTLA